MGINLNLKQDYSFLFSSLNNNKNNNNLLSSINISDYNSIKSGTYGKLLKQYYKQEAADVKDSASKKNTAGKTEVGQAKELKQIQTDANALRDTTSKLMQRGSKSVFASEDMEKVYSAVSEFAKNYNTLIDEGIDSGSKNIINGTEGLIDLVKDYEKELNGMGVTVDKNNQMVIDKETFLKSDIDDVKKLFQGNNFLSYLASMRAVSIGNTAYSESNKSSLYSGNGNYTVPSSGDIFNSIV